MTTEFRDGGVYKNHHGLLLRLARPHVGASWFSAWHADHSAFWGWLCDDGTHPQQHHQKLNLVPGEWVKNDASEWVPLASVAAPPREKWKEPEKPKHPTPPPASKALPAVPGLGRDSFTGKHQMSPKHGSAWILA